MPDITGKTTKVAVNCATFNHFKANFFLFFPESNHNEIRLAIGAVIVEEMRARVFEKTQFRYEQNPNSRHSRALRAAMSSFQLLD